MKLDPCPRDHEITLDCRVIISHMGINHIIEAPIITQERVDIVAPNERVELTTVRFVLDLVDPRSGDARGIKLFHEVGEQRFH